ncbi:hypothetical protein FPZ43_01325 [Mucilaginibacter pallidiroseus]|uniref:Uncharacterized protein n=1 Tax=Mucilaginibacter pallidiroseus TaxID=2599295 RepID=A0A563UIC1_9SPHI|nr:hypothetical protein [Mucilaginibacter pallidiroseus]TWR31150.1 hypothetical protein FPZ43_01325 [Mucilaginibacter pallidiroseus]
MTLDNFLNRLKHEYSTLDYLTPSTYYGCLSTIFVLLELDGNRLNAEYELGLDQLLEKMEEIYEEELETDLPADEIKAVAQKVKTGLGIIISLIEAE